MLAAIITDQRLAYDLLTGLHPAIAQPSQHFGIALSLEDGIDDPQANSLAPLWMPPPRRQLAMRSKSSVKVPKLRPGCPSRSAGTATYTFRAPTSRPAALGSTSPTMGRVLED